MIALTNARVHTGFTVLENSAVLIDGGVIHDVVTARRLKKMDLPEDTPSIDFSGRIIAPGFIDTHIHGIAGRGTEDGEARSIREMASALPRFGVTAFCPTIYPQEPEALLRSVEAAALAAAEQETEAAARAAEAETAAAQAARTSTGREEGEARPKAAEAKAAAAQAARTSTGREEGEARPKAAEAKAAAAQAARKPTGPEQGEARPEAAVLGIHLEGPFISPEQAGVQRPEHMRLPDIDLMRRLWDASGGRIISMTVAPELKGMRELAHYCGDLGIVLQAGHSNASYDQMLEGIQAGILHSTHFFNAMRPLHHRDPGVAGAILIHPEVSCEIIPDGFHVHPALIKLLMKGKPPDKIVMVSDALKPAGQEHGVLTANGEQVYHAEGVFRRAADNVIAGSALTMDAGVRFLVEKGFNTEVVLNMASANPAKVLRLGNRGHLLPGMRADIAVLDDHLNVEAVFIRGRRVP